MRPLGRKNWKLLNEYDSKVSWTCNFTMSSASHRLIWLWQRLMLIFFSCIAIFISSTQNWEKSFILTNKIYVMIRWKKNWIIIQIFNIRQSNFIIKFIYSEKATKFCEIFTLLLTVSTVVKSKVKILQNWPSQNIWILTNEMPKTF